MTNRLATGSLQINKVVDAPTGAYTGGTTKTFAGTYNCGAGFSGPFSTLTTATPVVDHRHPGRADVHRHRDAADRRAAPTPPTPGAPATYSDAAGHDHRPGHGAGHDHQPRDPAVRHVRRSPRRSSGPGGYTGGTDRVFPVAYTCTLADGPTTSGTLDVTLGGPVSPADADPGRLGVLVHRDAHRRNPATSSTRATSGAAPRSAPTTVTIGDDTTAAVTLTNTYIREFGSLVIAKQVVGGGYLGGDDRELHGQLRLRHRLRRARSPSPMAAARPSPPAGRDHVHGAGGPAARRRLLSPAFDWGTPTWVPGARRRDPGQRLDDAHGDQPDGPGLRPGPRHQGDHRRDAGRRRRRDVPASSSPAPTARRTPFTLGVGETGSTPDLPVGTSCTITETAPAGGLVDSSYAWGPTPPPQTVTITASGQVVAVTMTNTVVRVTRHAHHHQGADHARRRRRPGPRRSRSTSAACTANDPPVTGTVTLAAGATATTPPVLLGSRCTVTEDPARAAARRRSRRPVVGVAARHLRPGSASRGRRLGDDTRRPSPSSTRSASSRLVQRHQGGRRARARTAATRRATTFGFTVDLQRARSPTFDARRRRELRRRDRDRRHVVHAHRDRARPPTTPQFGWDPVQFTVNGVPPGTGDSVTFVSTIPPAGAPLQINVTNPITPRFGSVTVTKTVTGQTAGLSPAHRRSPSPELRSRSALQLDVPADGSATQGDIPAGSECTATESAPTGGLVDASYAWGDPDVRPRRCDRRRHRRRNGDDRHHQPDRAGHRAGAAGEVVHRTAGRHRPPRPARTR